MENKKEESEMILLIYTAKGSHLHYHVLLTSTILEAQRRNSKHATYAIVVSLLS